jgi:MFS family permease
MSPAETRHVNPWIVTAAVMLATFMEILDTTVVNVSVPHLAGNLGATVEEGTSFSRRSSVPRSEAGLPTTTPGAGSSTSTCPSV